MQALQCSTSRAARAVRPAASRSSVRVMAVARPQQARAAPVVEEASTSTPSWALASWMMASPLLLDVQSALAKDGEFGLLEGRTAALVHPAVMFALLGATL